MRTFKIDPVLHENIQNVLNFFGITDRCFFVGGSVRDNLLNINVNDYDIAVERVTHDEIVELNTHLHLTGEDFPVFRFWVYDSTGIRHEIELAVARRERSCGPGHSEFDIDFGEDISIEDDLSRRDLTINAIAIPVNNLNSIVDPFNGQGDLSAHIIRHTSSAFAEDPLRVFRVARFLAGKFSTFTVDQSTIELCRVVVNDIHHLSADRVILELKKMFQYSCRPSIFFRFLAAVDGLQHWFPELHSMIGIPQPIKYHGNNDVFDHTMDTIDNARSFTDNFDILMGALFHDVGKTLTPESILPAHHNHDNIGLTLVDGIARRLRLPGSTKNTIYDSVKNHMKIALTLEMRNKKVLDMVKGMRRNNTLYNAIAVAQADRMRHGGLDFDLIKKIHFADIALSESLPVGVVDMLTGKTGDQCHQIVDAFRLNLFNSLQRQ